MVKKITSTALLFLVMINHSFCDINLNNNGQDQASKNLNKTDKSSATSKANQNKPDQKTNQLSIVSSVLAIISTSLVIMERLTVALTGESFTVWGKQEPVEFKEIKLKLSIIEPLKTSEAKVAAIKIWAKKYNISITFSDENILLAIEALNDQTGFKSMLLGSSTTKLPINKKHRLELQEVVVRAVYNYLQGQALAQAITQSIM